MLGFIGICSITVPGFGEWCDAINRILNFKCEKKKWDQVSFKETDSFYPTPFLLMESHTVSGRTLWLLIELKIGKEVAEGSSLEESNLPRTI